MAVKKGLGRGFESLIPTDILDEEFDPTANQDEQISELRYIKTGEIKTNPDQPRRHFDETALEELKASITLHGILQPIIATKVVDGYQIVAGERRWRAAKALGLPKIPAIIRTLSAQHKLELALIENLQRRDLNPLETATAYLKLHKQFNLTYEEIGKRVGGKAISTIGNVLRLLQLPEEAKQALVGGDITEGHARQILALPDADGQAALLKHLVKDGWSVRKAEQFVSGYKQGNEEKKQQGITRTLAETPLTRAIEKSLSTKVSIKNTAKGGQLIIRYNDESELERISKRLL